MSILTINRTSDIFSAEIANTGAASRSLRKTAEPTLIAFLRNAITGRKFACLKVRVTGGHWIDALKTNFLGTYTAQEETSTSPWTYEFKVERSKRVEIIATHHELGSPPIREKGLLMSYWEQHGDASLYRDPENNINLKFTTIWDVNRPLPRWLQNPRIPIITPK